MVLDFERVSDNVDDSEQCELRRRIMLQSRALEGLCAGTRHRGEILVASANFCVFAS